MCKPKLCVHVKKQYLASRFHRVCNQSAIFPLFYRVHLRVLLCHHTREKAHELFNLLFLSIEDILRYEVSAYCRKHEPFLKSELFFENHVHFQKNVNKN